MKRLLLVIALCAPLFGQATGNTTIQPDCLIPFTFTAAGSFPATATTGGAGDNRTKGCAAWTLMYQNTGMTAVSVTLQSASTPGTSPSFGSFAGTISTGFVNPIVSDTGGSLQAVNGTADISWVRVNVAATGTGTLTGVLYGFRNSSAAVNGGGGSSNCPAGAINDMQFYVSAGVCGGDANLTWDGTILHATGLLQVAGPSTLTGDSGSPIALYVLDQANTVLGAPPNAIEADVFPTADFPGNELGVSAYMSANGHAITGAAAFWAGAQDLSGGTITTYYGFYSDSQTLATNNYYTWFDSQGVFRVRDDATFNSVSQAIPALYNPQVIKYTPGAANFERCIPGCQWESNVAVITTEKGGSGTLRSLQLGDAGVTVTFGGLMTNHSVAFAALGTPSNGTQYYCSDCTVTSGSDNTCANSGSGAFAYRVNGAWACEI